MRLRMNDDQPVHTIYGKIVKPGEEFEINDHEGRGWVLYGWAKEVTDSVIKPKRYRRSDMRADEE